MRYHCNYGDSEYCGNHSGNHLIFLVDDTIFDTYYSDEDEKEKFSVFRINFETHSGDFIVAWEDGFGENLED